MNPSSFPAFLERRSIVVLLYVLASAYVFGIWVWSADTPTTSFNGDPRSKLSDILYGTAHRPYVYRVFVPMLTLALYAPLAGPSFDSLEQTLLRIPKVQKETQRLGWETDFFIEYLIALFIAFVCLLAFSFVVRRFWFTLYETEPRVSNLVPIIALLALPPIFPTGPHYIYDFPTLFFFTLGLLLLVQQRWLLLYPIFFLGCLNKETMVLLTFLFLILFRNHLPTRSVLAHTGAQLLLFGIIKLILFIAFADNPGNLLDFHLYLNLHILLSGYGVVTLIVGVLLLWLIVHDFANKHPVLRRSLAVALPFGLLVMWGGVIVELRDVYELYPIVLFLVLHTLLFSLGKIPYSTKNIESFAETV